MGAKVLIDTNTSIGYIGNRMSKEILDKLDKLFNNHYHLSVINKIELLGFPNLDENEEAKFRLLIDHSILHQIDSKTIETTIHLKKKYRIKLPDAVIAATCLLNGLELLTLNIKDFEKIPELHVLTPDSL